MAKINIPFDNVDYPIDESALSTASAALKSHLSTVMNGSGATINLGGTVYNVDSTKLANATTQFVTHLGTIAGTGKKVVVNGVEYNVDSTKMAGAISDLHTVLGGLKTNGDEGESHNGTVPAGAFYLNYKTGTSYSTMPETVSEGDYYIYGDYIYRYTPQASSNIADSDGWTVSLATEDSGILNFIPNYPVTNRDKTSYQNILTSINGVDIVGLPSTFENCTNLIEAPKIPSSTLILSRAFAECDSLITAPAIPNGVVIMQATFKGCDKLTSAPFIPNSVTNLLGAFEQCSSITGAMEIPCTCETQDIGYDNRVVRHFNGCGHS